MHNNKGLIRRLDELGRVVIPKEIRHSLKIENGNMLEFFYSQEKGLCVQKFEPIRDIGDFGARIMYALREFINVGFLLCDMQKVIVAQNCSKKDNVGKRLNANFIEKLKNSTKRYESLHPFDSEKHKQCVVYPVVCEGDVVGGVIIISKEYATPEICGAVGAVSKILGDYLAE